MLAGMLCYLAGLKDPEHAAAGPLGGAIFETAVLLQIVKAFVNRGEEPQTYFWRTSAGVEVDLVVETGGKRIPIEVKLSATPRPAMANAIRTFQEDLGERAGPGYVIHPGDVRLPLAPKVVALPFTELESHAPVGQRLGRRNRRHDRLTPHSSIGICSSTPAAGLGWRQKSGTSVHVLDSAGASERTTTLGSEPRPSGSGLPDMRMDRLLTRAPRNRGSRASMEMSRTRGSPDPLYSGGFRADPKRERMAVGSPKAMKTRSGQAFPSAQAGQTAWPTRLRHASVSEGRLQRCACGDAGNLGLLE